MIEFLKLFVPMFRSYCVYYDEALLGSDEPAFVVPFMVVERKLATRSSVGRNMSYAGSFKTFEWLWMRFELDGGMKRIASEFAAHKGLEVQ